MGGPAFRLDLSAESVECLVIFSLVFSSISYWLSNFQPTAQAFFTWVLWVFLDLLAAESLVVFITSVFPSFVISLALVAFANGLWMSVNGFMVPPTVLNVFYRYVFHYWDYQKYVFENMMVNEFSQRVYTCARTAGDSCQCKFAHTAHPSVLSSGCPLTASVCQACGRPISRTSASFAVRACSTSTATSRGTWARTSAS